MYSEKDNKMRNKIAIKDIAKLMRMSTEALRYYEKRGILKPERDNENSYRYYSESDILKIISCRHYQELGFTIAEIIDLLNGYLDGDFMEILEMKHEEINTRISEAYQSITRIDEALETNAAYQRYNGKYFIMEAEHCMKLLYTRDSVLDKEGLHHSCWDIVSENMTKFTYMAELDYKAVEDSKEQELLMSEGFTIGYERGKKLGLEVNDVVGEIKPDRSVYTICKAFPVISREQIQPVIDWIKERKFKIKDKIYCKAHGLSYENGQICRFYEINVPIDDE